MYTIEKTLDALKARINDALREGKDSITLTLRDTGDKIAITFCGYKTAATVDEIEFFLVDCRFPWASSRNLADIAKLCNEWERYIETENDEKRQLQEYKQKHLHNGEWDEGSFDFFSDWFKSVYGHRPRYAEAL